MAIEDKLILNPSLYHARPHLGSKDYLHYWIFHAPGILEEAKKFGQRSEINILGHAKAKITRARKKQLLELQNANPGVPLESLQDVENILLRSDWLKNFSTVINNTPAPSFSMPSTQEILDNGGPSAMIEDAERAFEQISQAFQKLEEDIKKFLEKKSNADIEKYEEVLTAYFLDGYSTASKKKKYTVQGSSDIGLTDWQSKVLESILSRNNEGFFSASNQALYKKEFQDISGEKAKLLAIIKIFSEGREPVLKYIKDLALKKVKLRHHNTTKVEKLKTSQEVLDALFDKIGKYYQQLHAIAAEAATGEALKKLLEEFKDACGDSLTVDIKKDIGSKQLPVTITSNFRGNKRLFDLIETEEKKDGTQTHNAWSRAILRTSKSDSRFDITRNGVTVTQGFTVKDYQEYSVNPKLNKATIDLQKGTPLLTLLTREANLSPAKMHMIYQILSAHTDDETAMLSYAWNNIVKKAQYLAFLDTLAGFTNEQDKAFYFVFERKIYTLYDILGYLQDEDHYIDSIKWSDLHGEAGLEYSTYHNLDQWMGQKWRANPELAEKRSESTTKYISQWMYEVKIRVKLHIADLAAFRKLALKP